VNLSDELIAAYPDAKVILTNRDPEKWLHSIFQMYHRVLESRTFKIASVVDMVNLGLPLCQFWWLTSFQGLGALTEVLHLGWTDGDWRSREKLLEGYLKRYTHIREVVPKENLLEWEPKDGLEPLCEFLGRPVPQEPFPYANKRNDVSDRLLLGGKIRLTKRVVSKLVWPAIAVVAAC
jgi:hypothetical protein